MPCRIRSRIPSLTRCGGPEPVCPGAREPIPEARRRALPGVRLCLECQQEADKEQHAVHLYNRKGSKDSQLR